MFIRKRVPFAGDTLFRSPVLQPLHKGVLAGLLVFALLLATLYMSAHFGFSGVQSVIDDLLGGIIAGLCVYVYEKNRLNSLREKLLTIDLMNHHIRNALQPLMFLEFESNKEAHVRTIGECVTRIEFALREVLPGHSTEAFAEFGTAKPQPARRNT